MISKICTKCKKEYPATVEYFSKHPETKDGLKSHCKYCRRRAQKEYYNENIKHRFMVNQIVEQVYHNSGD